MIWVAFAAPLPLRGRWAGPPCLGTTRPPDRFAWSAWPAKHRCFDRSAICVPHVLFFLFPCYFLGLERD